jgi:hypothetical protein
MVRATRTPEDLMSPANEPSDAGAAAEGTLAQKINHLFETVRRPDGKSYSNEEVAEAINERGEATISGTYLWYLRRGDRDNPTKKHLEVLARFFDVSPAYFFDDGSRPPVDACAMRIAARLDGLSPRSLRTVADLIERVRELEGLPSADPDAPTGAIG